MNRTRPPNPAPDQGRYHDRRTESGTPPEAANGYSPDGWEANHSVLAHLAEHRVARKP
ncbi:MULTISPECIES: hypothetical protein [unclassified Streptomyces]|uniref:hypothetical protein n=1 Tax=unclassified Streptomyces TaxID=2593676 RepID=UPI00341FF5F7